MSDDEGFNLRALIREVCDSSTIADPETLAKEVGRRIGRADQRDALEQALVVVVRVAISRSRGPLVFSGGHGSSDTQGRNAAGASSSRSRKVAGLRETGRAWRRLLRERVNVGPNAYKFMSECTPLDLEYSAKVNDEHAAQNATKAAQKRALAALCIEHGAATVGQLPTSALDSAIGEAA